MARDRSQFQWVRNEDGGEVREQPERPDRRRAREVSREMEAVAERLVSLPSAQLDRLDLDPDLRAELDMLARVTAHKARRRQLRRMSRLLREVDIEALEEALEDAGALRARCERWRQRLIEGGAAELEAMIEAHPTIDRQQLRSLVRAARRGDPRAQRSARQLYQLIRQALQAPSPPT